MERFLPSPFSSKSKTSNTTEVGYTPVGNSLLICEVCFEETDTGRYYPVSKRLEFTCPDGHVNVVRGIEI